MNDLNFLRCNLCGNIISMVNDSGVIPVCCGEEMEHIIPKKADTGKEKHVPVIRTDGSTITVSIGDMPHPMTESHFIEWIVLQTNCAVYARRLTPNCTAEVCFHVHSGECPVRAYAWCNLHGLWLSDIVG